MARMPCRLQVRERFTAACILLGALCPGPADAALGQQVPARGYAHGPGGGSRAPIATAQDAGNFVPLDGKPLQLSAPVDPRDRPIVFAEHEEAAADSRSHTTATTQVAAHTESESAAAVSPTATSGGAQTSPGDPTTASGRRDLPPPGPSVVRPNRPADPTDRQDASTSMFSSLATERPISTAMAGLAIVLGTFFLLLWTLRRVMPRAARRLPQEVVEVLGHAPMSGKQTVHLLHLGGKVVLVALTPTGAQTLTEITQPEEVERILSSCQRGRPGSVSTTFREVLQETGGGSRGGSSPRRTAAADVSGGETPPRFSLWEGRDA